MSDVVFGRETKQQAFEAATFLAHQQFDGLRGNTPSGLKIDEALYNTLEGAGKLRVYTARVEGTMVAALVFILSEHTHRRGVVAQTDAVLIPEAIRRTGLASALIEFSLSQLAAEGVTAAQVVVKTAAGKSNALERLGFEPIETVYWKTLKD